MVSVAVVTVLHLELPLYIGSPSLAHWLASQVLVIASFSEPPVGNPTVFLGTRSSPNCCPGWLAFYRYHHFAWQYLDFAYLGRHYQNLDSSTLLSAAAILLNPPSWPREPIRFLRSLLRLVCPWLASCPRSPHRLRLTAPSV